MAGEKIEVNQGVLETEISNLNKLLGDIQASGIKPFEINGDGYTKQYMEVIDSAFIGAINSLQVLIDSTVSMLEEVKDGYIEIDEQTKGAIEDFKEEVLG